MFTCLLAYNVRMAFFSESSKFNREYHNHNNTIVEFCVGVGVGVGVGGTTYYL